MSNKTTTETPNVHPLGSWSMIGTLLAIFIGAIYFSGFDGFWAETQLFLVGATEKVEVFHIEEALGPLLAAVIVIFALAVPAGKFSNSLSKKSTDHAVLKALLPGHEKRMFSNFYLSILFVEEGVARWLFFGYLYGVTWLHNPVCFWLLFTVGNGLFAVVHLVNYKPGERQLVRVLPQFVASIPLTWAFMKYGFLGVFIAHFAYDCVLFAAVKVQKFDGKDVRIIGLGCVYAAFGWLWLQQGAHSFAELHSWFSSEPTFKLEGWNVLDYFALIVLVDGVTDVLFGLLGYDRPNLEVYRSFREKLNEDGLGWSSPQAVVAWFLVSVVNAVFIAGVALVGTWALGHVIDNCFLKAFVLGSILCFFHRAESGSALARSFFEHVPEMMVLVACFYALGFWWTLLLAVLWGVVHMPAAALKSHDD